MPPTLRIVADENIPCLSNYFSHLGEIVSLPGRKILAKHLSQADVLLVRSVTPVNSELLADSSVKFVGSTTIGVDHVDRHYLRENNIQFSFAPGCNARSVVEYVIAALWALRPDLGNIRDRKVAIIGCGNVGWRLADLLDNLGFQVKVCDPLIKTDSRFEFVDLSEALQADIISLHTPLTHTGEFATHHMINASNIDQIRAGTLLINTSRGAVIDNQALLTRLQSRVDLFTVLDVWENEPIINMDLMQCVNVATPHISGYSFDGKLAGTRAIYHALCRFLQQSEEFPQLSDIPLDRLMLVGNAALDGDSFIGDLLTKIYDIQSDDQRFRQALSASGANIKNEFDQLRKSYPIRREWSNFTLAPTVDLSSLQRRLLAILGIDIELRKNA